MRDDRPAGEGSLVVRTLVAGPLENNVYLAACPVTGRAVLIDPADDADRILEAAAGLRSRPSCSPTAITTTSGPPGSVCRALGVPLHLHPADAALAGLPGPGPWPTARRSPAARWRWRCCTRRGTLPGSVCFLAGATLFSGDTLFPGGPGATDGPAAFRAR